MATRNPKNTDTSKATPDNVIKVTPVSELPPVIRAGRARRDYSEILKNPGVWNRIDRTYSKNSASIGTGMVKQATALHGGKWEAASRTAPDGGDTVLFLRYTPEAAVTSKSTKASK